MKKTSRSALPTSPTQTPMLYRIASVKELLQVSQATIYRMVARGELELVRLSLRSSRITSASVARVIEGRQKTAQLSEKFRPRRE